MKTITHQGIERLPNGVTRCWSKWTDGSITHSDTVDTYHETPHGTMIGTMYVGFEIECRHVPPVGLEWVDTAKILASVRP